MNVDPVVSRINNACNYLKLAGIVIGGGIAVVIVSPLAMVVSVIALPILGVQYWMENRNHQFLLNKMLEVYSGHKREKTGPTKSKNYMENIPKKLDSCSWDNNGSKFNTVRDLSWLWFEYHRLDARKEIDITLPRIKSYAYALIPIIGICYNFFRIEHSVNDDAYDKKSPTPKIALEAHFEALRCKFERQIYHENFLSSPNREYHLHITNTALNRSNILKSKIPSNLYDLPVDQFYDPIP